MKDLPLTAIEHHPSRTTSPDQAIRKVITTWLTKELYK